MAFAGGNTCGHAHQTVDLERAQHSSNHHPNTITEGRRECEQDVYSGIQPLCPPFIGALIKRLDLGSEHGDDGTGRVARLQLGGEGMGGNICLRLLFVLVQSGSKYRLEAHGRCRSRRNLRHSGSWRNLVGCVAITGKSPGCLVYDRYSNHPT
jgi:hypothetical protein